MLTITRACLLVLLTILGGLAPATAEIYRWVTPGGVVAYSDTRPPRGAYEVWGETAPGAPSRPEREEPGAAELPAPSPRAAAEEPDERVVLEADVPAAPAPPEVPILSLEAEALPRAYLSPAALAVLSETGAVPASEATQLLIGVTLSNVFLAAAELPAVRLPRASLGGAYLGGADLPESELPGAFLVGASLFAADLAGADLRQADLQGADVRGANLQGADLHGAHLVGANLQGADLTDADLRGVDLTLVLGLTLEQLALAYTDDTTQLPAEFAQP